MGVLEPCRYVLETDVAVCVVYLNETTYIIQEGKTSDASRLTVLVNSRHAMTVVHIHVLGFFFQLGN